MTASWYQTAGRRRVGDHGRASRLQDVGGQDVGVELDVVRRPVPGVASAAEQVVHLERRRRRRCPSASSGELAAMPAWRVPRVEVHDDEDRGPSPAVLGVGEQRVVAGRGGSAGCGRPAAPGARAGCAFTRAMSSASESSRVEVPAAELVLLRVQVLLALRGQRAALQQLERRAVDAVVRRSAWPRGPAAARTSGRCPPCRWSGGCPACSARSSAGSSRRGRSASAPSRYSAQLPARSCAT